MLLHHRTTRNLLIAMTVAVACPSALMAQNTVLPGQEPLEMEGVGIVQKLDEQVPTDLEFVDSTGKTVRMADLLDGEKPVILTLNYYQCPMLCSLTLNGLVDGLSELEWSAGDEFNIVTLSIAPEETPDLAARKKKSYVTDYGRESAGKGWWFLTGDEEDITALADAVGFGYRYDDVSGEFAHTSSIVFLTPDGRISLYMNDVVFKPRDLRLALVESSEGRIGSPLDTLLLFNCFQWDSTRNSYVVNAWKIVRLGGVLTVLLVIAGLFVLGFKNSRSSSPDSNGGDAT